MSPDGLIVNFIIKDYIIASRSLYFIDYPSIGYVNTKRDVYITRCASIGLITAAGIVYFLAAKVHEAIFNFLSNRYLVIKALLVQLFLHYYFLKNFKTNHFFISNPKN